MNGQQGAPANGGVSVDEAALAAAIIALLKDHSSLGIPALLRGAIEGAFSKGHLDYIVCTSTLLQGVNLPARNVFMQNPHKGVDHPIDPVDFWNLAGRAGRLGKDFQGNVFLVDYDTWDSAPLT